MDSSDSIVIQSMSQERQPSIEIIAKLEQNGKKVAARILLDSGATGSLIHEDMVKRHKLNTKKLGTPIAMVTVDKTKRYIDEYVQATMTLRTSKGHHSEEIKLYVGNIGKNEAILGTDWLVLHNPEINWTDYTP